MFTPGLAIFYLATILRFSHVCGVRTGFSTILSAGACWCLGSPELYTHRTAHNQLNNQPRNTQYTCCAAELDRCDKIYTGSPRHLIHRAPGNRDVLKPNLKRYHRECKCRPFKYQVESLHSTLYQNAAFFGCTGFLVGVVASDRSISA
jgi:hypothetical protein